MMDQLLQEQEHSCLYPSFKRLHQCLNQHLNQSYSLDGNVESTKFVEFS